MLFDILLFNILLFHFLPFDILLFDILSFDILSFDILSFNILSFEILSLDKRARSRKKTRSCVFYSTRQLEIGVSNLVTFRSHSHEPPERDLSFSGSTKTQPNYVDNGAHTHKHTLSLRQGERVSFCENRPTCRHFFVQNKTFAYFTIEKSSPKILATFVIFNCVPKVNNRPKKKIRPIWSPWS
jgi:hypothetical protein